MKAAIIVEVDDGWVERRVAEYAADHGLGDTLDALGFFLELLRDIAEDELPFAALSGWPVEITVEPR